MANLPRNKIHDLADKYAASKGLQLQHGGSFRADPAHAQKIAQAYGEMKHDPNHPEVKAAYGALKKETAEQFKHIMNSGLKVSRMKPGQENPYKSSKDMHKDVHENNHLWYYPTSDGFGSEGSAPKDHPMLESTGMKHDGHDLLHNDAFRIVHDVFGHAKEGYGFGAHGEESAWAHHKQMYSPLAQKALTAETRGQNSFVNFGPNAAHNKANPGQTVYADQKAGIMPDWTLEHPQVKKSESNPEVPMKKDPHWLHKASTISKPMEKTSKIDEKLGRTQAGARRRASQVNPPGDKLGRITAKENFKWQGGINKPGEKTPRRMNGPVKPMPKSEGVRVFMKNAEPAMDSADKKACGTEGSRLLKSPLYKNYMSKVEIQRGNNGANNSIGFGKGDAPDVKSLIQKPHIIFSTENPQGPAEVHGTHEEILAALKQAGETVHEAHGKYGGKEERAIFVSEPKNPEAIHKLAHGLGQESHLESDGYNHALVFHHGPNAGEVTGSSGSEVHEQEPQDNYTKIGDTFFTHKIQ